MKKYDENKICFIICSNNEQFLNECIMYLNQLYVPDDIETELLVIQDAKSMTSGYNEAMNASDAKYKVYLHQDTFICCREFIYKLLEIFQSDDSIGIVGMIGAEKLSSDGVMWHLDRCGDFYNLEHLIENGVKDIEQLQEGIREVEVVDGLLIATQYDIPWREDILKGWDFYDVSQCLEFRRKGYKIVVPAQRPSWTNHRCGAPSFWNYNANREIVLREYKEIAGDERKPKILFVRSDSISILSLAIGLTLAEHNVQVWDTKVPFSRDDKISEALEETLEESHCDMVMSFDFSIAVAEACHSIGVKYISWVYDSPLFELFTEIAKYDTNHIRVFDRKQYDRMKEFGLKHLYYGPLAVDLEYFGAIIPRPEDEEKYSADISFVGRLYNRGKFDELFDKDGEIYREEINNLFINNQCRWNGSNILFNSISEEAVDYIFDSEDKYDWDSFCVDDRYYVESYKLARKLNEIERTSVLNHLAKKHKIVLYTDDKKLDKLNNVIIRDPVDYDSGMSMAYYFSKINLNITSRSIESGLPQRIFDIMSVGGFVLTSYQEEIEEYFEIGKEIEVFHDLNELERKVDYYLNHEKERIQIAMNGYKKVRDNYSYTILAPKWIDEIQGNTRSSRDGEKNDSI